jgi:predicted nucleic acid-binding protein
VRLVADANVLLSAVIGGRAALALRHDDVEQVLTPATALDEVFEYLPSLARKKRLELDTLLLACAALPVTVVERPEYQQKLPAARRRIGKRDPDDVDVLALALALNLPVWSNDNDFEDSGVDWHTTAELLKMLGIESR